MSIGFVGWCLGNIGSIGVGLFGGAGFMWGRVFGLLSSAIDVASGAWSLGIDM